MTHGLRSRIRDLLGKGAELLEQHTVAMPHSVTGSLTRHAVIGPFDVDMDVHDVVCTSAVPVAAGANTLDVFNNAVAANPVITQFDPDTLVAGVPSVKAVTGNRRLAADDVIIVRFVVAVANEDEDVSVTVRLERVLHEPSAKVTTYGAYPS